MRTGGACPNNVFRAGIEVSPETDKVNGKVEPGVRDGIPPFLKHERLGGLQSTIAEFLEERQEPLFAGQRSARVGHRERLHGWRKTFPNAEYSVPRAADGFIELLAAAKVIGVGRQPLNLAVALRQAIQEVRG